MKQRRAGAIAATVCLAVGVAGFWSAASTPVKTSLPKASYTCPRSGCAAEDAPTPHADPWAIPHSIPQHPDPFAKPGPLQHENQSTDADEGDDVSADPAEDAQQQDEQPAPENLSPVKQRKASRKAADKAHNTVAKAKGAHHRKKVKAV